MRFNNEPRLSSIKQFLDYKSKNKLILPLISNKNTLKEFISFKQRNSVNLPVVFGMSKIKAYENENAAKNKGGKND